MRRNKPSVWEMDIDARKQYLEALERNYSREPKLELSEASIMLRGAERFFTQQVSHEYVIGETVGSHVKVLPQVALYDWAQEPHFPNNGHERDTPVANSNVIQAADRFASGQ